VATQAYAILRELVARYHERLADAKIALAWNLAWKADKDGIVHLGKPKRAGELDRLMHGYDLIVLRSGFAEQGGRRERRGDGTWPRRRGTIQDEAYLSCVAVL